MLALGGGGGILRNARRRSLRRPGELAARAPRAGTAGMGARAAGHDAEAPARQEADSAAELPSTSAGVAGTRRGHGIPPTAFNDRRKRFAGATVEVLGHRGSCGGSSRCCPGRTSRIGSPLAG